LEDEKLSQGDFMHLQAVDLMVIVLNKPIHHLLVLLNDLDFPIVNVTPAEIGQVNRVRLEVAKLIYGMHH
jgi:hypothetical protein